VRNARLFDNAPADGSLFWTVTEVSPVRIGGSSTITVCITETSPPETARKPSGHQPCKRAILDSAATPCLHLPDG